MSAILIKIFATALTLSQAMTRPEAIRTEFDRDRDRGAVTQILRDGCAHMRKAFDIEDINVDELIAVAMEDPKAVGGDSKIFEGLSFKDLHTAYREYCRNETVEAPAADLGEVIDYYNKAVADLPDHTKLKDTRLPVTSTVLDGAGARFTEIYEPDGRRSYVPLSEIPPHVRQAFIAAEDKRFLQHRGIDERGVIRAFVNNLGDTGRPAGGSTITQQVVKNLIVGDDVTYDRKMREMIVAVRLERAMSKDEILEKYLNTIYLGRASWGIEMAARSWFGKSAKQLDLAEGAFLAGLTKGPNYYSPDRRPDRARDRLGYVLTRLKDDGLIDDETLRKNAASLPKFAAFEAPRREGGLHFVDLLARDARAFAGIEGLSSASYTIRSTLNAPLQAATEGALQEGLARYELATGRFQFGGPEGNLAEAITRLDQASKAEGEAPTMPAWRRALIGFRAPLYDVRWASAVVLDLGRGKGGQPRVGLKDGQIVPLTAWNAATRGKLKLHDVVMVRLVETRGKGGKVRTTRAELRARPAVQGAAVAIENRTGKILALSGGFSYPLSQLNRVTQAHRQPGSALKPLTYLLALNRGFQPNTLVYDLPVTLSPVDGGRDSWSPRNADGGAAGILTLRRALESSKNLVTARLLDGVIDTRPERALRSVCELALEAQLYAECERYYPFVLGAQPVRVLDLAALYGAIANEGERPSPYAIESIEKDGATVYRREARAAVRLASADRISFYQMKTILQGVVERGTARALKHLAPYVAGKTGTTDDENDAWFVGFTNEITIAVWVGYDNADGKRRTLGRGQSGGKVALPIFEAIVQAAWQHHAPRTPLEGPSPAIRTQIADLRIDVSSGNRLSEYSTGGFIEHFRRTPSGRIDDTQYALIPREEVYAYREPREPWGEEDPGGFYGEGDARGPYAQAPFWREDPYAHQREPDPWWYGERRPQRVDPDYLWGRRQYY